MVNNTKELTPQEKYWQIFESLDSRNLPLEVRKTLARLLATESNEIPFVIKSPLDLYLREPLRLPDKAELSYWRSEKNPEVPGETPTLSPQQTYFYLWKKKLGKVDEEAVKESYYQVSTAAALLAFSYDLPIEWEDPRVPPSTTIRSRSIDIKKFDRLVKDLCALPHETRVAIERAISWYWGGQLVCDVPYAILYEYTCYWNVIEVLAKEIGEAKIGDEGIERAMTSRLKSLLGEEDLQNVLNAFRYGRTLKQKVRSFLGKIMPEEKEKAKKVFQKIFVEKRNGDTLYGVRNNIAHGKFLVSEVGLERIVQGRVWELRSHAKDLLLQTTRSPTLQKLLETKGRKERAGRAVHNIVKLEGLWKDIPFEITDEDIRETRQELGQQIASRARKAR